METKNNPTLGYADVVLDYFDSGKGPKKGPYGGNTEEGILAKPVSLDVVLGDDPEPGGDYLSLPTNSFVTVGFTDETIIDGPGDDIFIQEYGKAGERAKVFVSSDLKNFELLGTAKDDEKTSFDLASIKFKEPVQAIKIVGLDSKGDSPGFDVANVQVLENSVGPKPTEQCPIVSETVKAPFTDGPSAVTTANTYSGKVKIDITGVGQAAGTSSSDSFYRFTDNGTKIDPVPANEFGLYINGKPAQSLFPSSQDIPSYNPDHSYSFTIDARNGELTFGVGDTFTVDNTGFYNITISELSGNCDLAPPSNGEF
jgi:hypothetical protein